MQNNVDYIPLIPLGDGRIGIRQSPWNTWPKIPWNAISATSATLGNITSNNIVPSANNAYDIGLSANRYNNIYCTELDTTTATIWTATIGTLDTTVLTITSTNIVQASVEVQDSYLEVSINGVTYKLLLAS